MVLMHTLATGYTCRSIIIDYCAEDYHMLLKETDDLATYTVTKEKYLQEAEKVVSSSCSSESYPKAKAKKQRI